MKNNRTNEAIVGAEELHITKLNGIEEILSAEINSYKPQTTTNSKTKRAQSS